jgi:hypothetical protein
MAQQGSTRLVAAGTSKGLVRFRRSGSGSWEVGDLALPGWAVTALARADDGTWWVGAKHDVYGPSILTSPDLERFEACAASPGYEGRRANELHMQFSGFVDFDGTADRTARRVDQIWKLLPAGDRMYAGVSEAGLFLSDDRGATWRSVPALDEHPDREHWQPGAGGLCAHSLLRDARDPRRLWVGISAAGVFRSDDGGETFVARNEGIDALQGEEDGGAGAYCVHGLAHDPSHADRIYRQDHRGVYRSDDGGDHWTLIEAGLPAGELSDGHRCCFGFPIAFDAAADAVFVIPLASDQYRYPHGGRLRVYRSRDGGGSWQGLDAGLPAPFHDAVLRGALAVDGHGGVAFGTAAGTVHASDDLGERWETLPGTHSRVLCVAAAAS